MRIWVASLLIVAGAAVAEASAQTPDTATTLDAVRALSARTYAMSREIDDANRSADPGDLRKQADAVAAALATGAKDANVIARKLRNVSLLIGNIERAAALTRSGATRTLLPRHKPSPVRSSFAHLDAGHGTRCESALGLGVGSELDGMLDAGGEVWVHVQAPAAQAIKVDTAVSALDTEIAVFAACPAQGEPPLSTSDDGFGLAAVAILGAKERSQAYWLRVRNLGARGEVGIVADTTGAISGTISWVASDSAWYATASAFDSLGYYVGGDRAETGAYSIALDPGSYYVAASANGNVTQLWPAVECGTYFVQDCAHAPAQMVDVDASNTTTGIDFALDRGARINGRVRDAITGLAIANARVAVSPEHPDTPNGYPTTQSDGTGRFVLDALAAGRYHVQANSYRYLLQAYDGVDCPTGQTCADDAGTAITLTRQGAFDHADFNLHPAAFVRFVVHATPLDWWSQISITGFDPSGTAVASVQVSAQSPIEIGPLAPGGYRFVAAMQGQVSQLYDHIDCATDCRSELAGGTVVQVSAAAPETTVTFDLHALASVSGRITDSASGTGLADVLLTLWPTSGGNTTQDRTAADGAYALAGIAPGTYWLRASSADHRDTAYANAPCDDNSYSSTSGCQLTSAQAIVVGRNDVANIDMALPMNGRVAGYVRETSAGAPIPSWAAILLYDSAGTPLRYTTTSASGEYAFDDLVAGSYFAQATDTFAFTQIYAGIDCPIIGTPCDATVGTPIVLAQGTQRSDVDFTMIPTRRIVGRVTDAISGRGIAGVVIDAWDPHSEQHCDDASTDIDGYYWIDDSGTCDASSTARWLSTDARPGHVDQVFDGIACPNGPAYLNQCALTGANAVAFPVTPTLSRADFSLARPDAIFSNGFDATVVTAMRAHR